MSTMSQFNMPVYDYAVGWFRRQPANPLAFIAPVVQVDGQVGTFKRYPQGSVFRRADTRRVRLNPYNAIDVEAEDVPFVLEDHGLRVGVDDTDINPGTGNRQEAADQIAQSRMGSLLGTWRTSMIADGFAKFRSGVAATTQVGSNSSAGEWSGADADPMAVLRQLFREFAERNGVYPNRVLFARGAWDVLANNAAMLDLVAYNDAKVLTPELLVKLLDVSEDAAGHEVQIMRSIIPVAETLPGPGVAFDGKDALGSDVWLTYAEDVQSIGDMSGLKTLCAGGEDMVDSVESYYVRQDRATWYEVNMSRQFVVSAPSAVVRLSIS